MLTIVSGETPVLAMPRRRSLLSAFVLSLAVSGVAIPAAQAGRVPPKPKVVAEVVTERPDATSAMLTARSQGSKVEDLSARTETASTFANPDGTWTLDATLGVRRFREGGSGKWVDVDLDLAEQPDGSVGSKAHPLGLKLPGKGQDGAISLGDAKGRSVDLQWKGTLPKPTLEGTKATYAEVSPGVDMVVEALRSGYEQFFILKDRPVEGAPGLSWDLPLKTKGLSPRPRPDGGVDFVDNQDKVISRIPAAVAWDVQRDEFTQDPINISPVKLEVIVDNPGNAVLRVTPDPGWLADPATQYPVTVDPAQAWRTPTLDTFVQEGSAWTDGANNAIQTELKLGKNDVTGLRARSILRFELGSLKGVRVLFASINLWETYSPDCSPQWWESWQLGRGVDSTVNWDNQPAWDKAWHASNQTKGSGGCPAAWVGMDVTGQAQFWADNAEPNNQLGLRANQESTGASWKKFASSETSTQPHIYMNYNRPPSVTTWPWVSSGAWWNGSWYSNTTTPSLSAAVSDPEGDALEVTHEVHSNPQWTDLKGSCKANPVASGATGTCTTGALTGTGPFYIRTGASDGYHDGGFQTSSQFMIAAQTPAKPVITCPDVPAGTWVATAPEGSVSCKISAVGSGTSAPVQITYQVDGATPVTASITPSGDPNVAKVDLTVPKTAGGHRVHAIATSPSGLPSTAAVYGFGYGTVGMTLPVAEPVQVTTGNLAVTAQGPKAPGDTPTAKLKWRLPGGTGAWNTATDLAVTADSSTGGLTASGTWDTRSATKDTAGSGATLDERLPATLEIQACINYAAGEQCTWIQGIPSSQRRVLRVPHAFGNGFPVTDAGPGQVALWTGEYTTSSTDVSTPAYVGALSVSRTHSTFAGDPATPAAGAFGPGWTAAFDGPDAGLAGMQLIDNTGVDGTLVLVDSEGTASVFAPPGDWDSRAAGAPLTTGLWDAVDSDTKTAGLKAEVTSPGTFIITTADGSATTFVGTETAGEFMFKVASVTEAGVPGAVTYTHNASGLVTRILAPTPPGVTCPASGALVAGCRALDITYGTTGQSGEVTGQVKKIDMVTFDPAANSGAGAMTSTTVATYTYGTDKRLTSVADPRAGLTTTYSYDSAGRLTGLTPPGVTGFNVEYDSGKLARVKRTNPTSIGGTATLATVLYNIPKYGAGLPDFRAEGVAAWGQTTAPTWAAAVFGSDKAVTTLDPSQVASGDWPFADIYATDARGYTINTASYGAGEWLPTSTEYDQYGNPYLTRSATDIAAIKAGASATTAATVTTYNTAGNGPAATEPGSVVMSVLGPARQVILKDGTAISARPKTTYVYDEGAPNGGINPATGKGWALPTTVTSGPAQSNETGILLEPATATRTTYGPGAEEWKLGLPRQNIQEMGGSTPDIVTKTGYDSIGRVTSQEQPKSNGTDAGTRRTAYYTAGANPDAADCGGKPQWAGAVCKTWYAGQASGQDLITSKVTAYDKYLAPATVLETANGATRTTTTTFDSAGRPVTSKTTTSGLTGSTAVKGTKTTWSSTTGLPTKTEATDASGAVVGDPVATGYDTWGRAVSYSPKAGDTTTTVFDAVGRVASVADPKGTTTYGYGADANGKNDRRGLPTSVTVSGGPGGAQLVTTGAYDVSGNLVLEKLPGGITKTLTTDLVGNVESMTYSGQITTTGGGTQPNQPWLGWTQHRDYLGHVARELTPTGAAFTTNGGTSGGAAAAYDRIYAYDNAGRLTKVTDRTANAGGGVDPATGAPSTVGCQTRTYGFDANGNRTSLTKTPANPDGTCGTPGSNGASTKSWAYDAGNRLTGGYVYDAFGRQTTLPAVDAPVSGAGAITLGYFDTDAVASITQNGQTTAFTLDQVGRRATEATGPTGQAATMTTTRNYADGSDSPAWVTVIGGSTPGTTRYAETLGGMLGLTITTPAAGAVTAELALADLHGDIVATTNLPASSNAVGITGWIDHDEYGNPLGATAPTDGAVTQGVGYGWHGAQQRATEETGLTLMGARVYNRATGSFTSVDPIYGGNTTAYAYPQDPVNGMDLDGLKNCKRFDLKCKAKKILDGVENARCNLTAACLMTKHGTWTGSLNSPIIASVGLGYGEYGTKRRAYVGGGGNSIDLKKMQTVRPKGGVSVTWSPGRPNDKASSPVSVTYALCRFLCLGVSSGYRGAGTYKGVAPAIGFGFGGGAMGVGDEVWSRSK